jgi:hypothetical protein
VLLEIETDQTGVRRVRLSLILIFIIFPFVFRFVCHLRKNCALWPFAVFMQISHLKVH